MAGWDLDIVYLDVPVQVAKARCTARGSMQDETWWKGRCTKVNNLLNKVLHYQIDGTLPVEDIAKLLRARPALVTLFGR